MNYLITGCAGFVGRNMLEFLVTQQHDKIFVTDTRFPDYLGNEKFKDKGVIFIESNLKNKKSLKVLVKETKNNKIKKIDAIFHIAALFDFFAKYKELYKVNVEGTRNLCEAFNGFAKRVINWSSGAVYGNNYPSEITENCEPHPGDNYSKSKYLAELETQRFSSDMEIITIRPAAIYGPHSKYGDAKVLYLLKKGILFALPFKDARNTHAHVSDIVGAAFFLSNININDARKQSNSLIYNIADDTSYPTSEILTFAYDCFKEKPLEKFPDLRAPDYVFELLAEITEEISLKYKINPLFERDSVNYLFYSHILSNKKIKELGYKFKYPDTKGGLRGTIAWYESINWSLFGKEEKFIDTLYRELLKNKPLALALSNYLWNSLKNAS